MWRGLGTFTFSACPSRTSIHFICLRNLVFSSTSASASASASAVRPELLLERKCPMLISPSYDNLPIALRAPNLVYRFSIGRETLLNPWSRTIRHTSSRHGFRERAVKSFRARTRTRELQPSLDSRSHWHLWRFLEVEDINLSSVIAYPFMLGRY